MQFDPLYFEDSSVHYYFPAQENQESFLYYPVSVGYFDCTPSYHLQRNIFSSYLLIVMLTGSLSFQTLHSQGVAHPGQVLLLDCNAPHAYAANGKCSFTFIHFSGAHSSELYARIVSKGGNLLRTPQISILHETIGELLSSMRDHVQISPAHASGMIYSILMSLWDNCTAAESAAVANPVADKAISYIQCHLTERLTVEDVAAYTGYSASYFSHLFSSATGMSPYQFIVRSRVEQAQQLLKTTQLSIQEISFQCGFNSAANFCYTFRKTAGCSPQEYRKRLL